MILELNIKLYKLNKEKTYHFKLRVSTYYGQRVKTIILNNGTIGMILWCEYMMLNN